MSKHIIFLTHGMGNHVHGEWEIPIINMLNDLYKSYKLCTYENKSLAEFVEFVPITYDNIFRKQVSMWEKNFDVLFTNLNQNSHFNSTPITDWLRIASPKEQDFFWTHIVDVLLYRFLPNITQMVRIHVINQIKDKLKNETDVPNCSIIAHSLGTAVIHDSLHLLFTTAWGGLPNLLLQQFKFQSITMLANTSRVLTNDVPDTGEFYDKIYNSVVKPNSCVLKYFNCRHVYDPIPSWIYRFNPPWNDSEQYHNIVIRHISQVNLHDYMHYLENPAVHIPIFRTIFGEYAISANEARAKQEEFDSLHQQLVADINPKLEYLITNDGERDLDQNINGYIQSILAYYSTL